MGVTGLVLADVVALLTALQPAAKPSVQETAFAKLLADSARDAAKNPPQAQNRRDDYADKLRTTAVKVQTALELQRSGSTARAEALWSEAAKLMPVVILFGRAAAGVVLEVVIKGFYVTLKGSVVDAEAFLDVLALHCLGHDSPDPADELGSGLCPAVW